MYINQDVWDEFILWAKVVYYTNPEADIYDVFMRIRQEQGGQPFTKSMLKTVDYAIQAEDRRNARNNLVGG